MHIMLFIFNHIIQYQQIDLHVIAKDDMQVFGEDIRPRVLLRLFKWNESVFAENPRVLFNFSQRACCTL